MEVKIIGWKARYSSREEESMEDAILKRYEDEINKPADKNWKGIKSRLSKREKYCLFFVACMIVCTVLLLLLQRCERCPNLYLIFAIMDLIFAIITVGFSRSSTGTSEGTAVDKGSERLDKLDKILLDEFGMQHEQSPDFNRNVRNRILVLIELYQTLIDKAERWQEGRNTFWTVMVGAIGAVLAGLLSLMLGAGIDPWFFVVLFIYFMTFAAASWAVLRIFQFYNSKKIKYEEMVRNLKLLLLIKYSDSGT